MKKKLLKFFYTHEKYSLNQNPNLVQRQSGVELRSC